MLNDTYLEKFREEILLFWERYKLAVDDACPPPSFVVLAQEQTIEAQARRIRQLEMMLEDALKQLQNRPSHQTQIYGERLRTLIDAVQQYKRHTGLAGIRVVADTPASARLQCLARRIQRVLQSG